MPVASISPKDRLGSPVNSEISRRANLGAVSWIAVEEMEHPEWVVAGRRLGAMGRGSGWWVGDWVCYGAARWGEKYVEAARITGYDIHTLRNLAYVAMRFDVSLRRDNLTWSHHAVVAALEPEDRDHWLDLAVSKKFSVADLKAELRSSRRRDKRIADLNHRKADRPSSSVGVVCPRCGYEIPSHDSEEED
jgi:hypothetical protein